MIRILSYLAVMEGQGVDAIKRFLTNLAVVGEVSLPTATATHGLLTSLLLDVTQQGGLGLRHFLRVLGWLQFSWRTFTSGNDWNCSLLFTDSSWSLPCPGLSSGGDIHIAQVNAEAASQILDGLDGDEVLTGLAVFDEVEEEREGLDVGVREDDGGGDAGREVQ